LVTGKISIRILNIHIIEIIKAARNFLCQGTSPLARKARLHTYIRLLGWKSILALDGQTDFSRKNE